MMMSLGFLSSLFLVWGAGGSSLEIGGKRININAKSHKV